MNNDKKNFCFCQVSTNLINRDKYDFNDLSTKYYNEIWRKKSDDGYVKPDDFWELPLWIAELSYCLQGEKELCIIEDEKQVLPDADYYFFSVLDVNKQIIQQIIHDNPKKHFIIGGYADLTDLWYDYTNIDYFGTIKQCVVAMGFDYEYGLDYSLFAGLQCIPRLTLSKGCSHKCKFCTVGNEVIESSPRDITAQIEAMKMLNFKLVYINDKTFGQCKNHRHLKYIYNEIKHYNPNFEGFIIQTTCNQVLRLDKSLDLHRMGIRVVEIGVESYNNNILSYYNKPQNTKVIDEALKVLDRQDIKIIPNLIIGLLCESFVSYGNTIHWLFENRHKLYMLNIYNYAYYADAADLDSTFEITADDTDELKTQKSFHSSLESFAAKNASLALYTLALEIL